MKSKMITLHIQIVLSELLKEQGWLVKSSKEGIIFYLPNGMKLPSKDPDHFFNWTNEILNISKIELMEVTRFDYFQNNNWLSGIFLYPDGYDGEIPEKR